MRSRPIFMLVCYGIISSFLFLLANNGLSRSIDSPNRQNPIKLLLSLIKGRFFHFDCSIQIDSETLYIFLCLPFRPVMESEESSLE